MMTCQDIVFLFQTVTENYMKVRNRLEQRNY